MNERAELNGLHALIVGFAREGTALARFLVDQGARVTITDVKSAGELGDGLATLADLPVVYHLGGHPLHVLEGSDVVFVSPGVPLEIPLLIEARRRRVPLSSETRLFTRVCPAPIAGITGSSGKTTTTSLVGEILKAEGSRTWVGGNIGQPMIGHLDEMRGQDAVVMELSSFQLELMKPQPDSVRPPFGRQPAFWSDGWSPHIAAILNITPNHLDRHDSMAKYISAKVQIVADQSTEDSAILGWDNPVTRKMGRNGLYGQHVLWFSQETEVDEGAFLRGEELLLRLEGHEEVVCRRSDVQLLGRHNVANALAACAISAAAGAGHEAMRQTVTSFPGVPHRLELVCERDGVRWYNDSIATTPERAMAALQSFTVPIVLLAGGRDKHLPWDSMARLTLEKVRHLILFGEAAELISEAVEAARSATAGACQVHEAGTLERAIGIAARLAKEGEVVLLAPGGTSFDAYTDYAARGEHFRQLVAALE